ncbi:MFS transporter [Gordonia sp. ABSL1-1]|uniref:MFS transporter n=1 Tax=Gordonia sp. ABSL1-1 TaxID=3053923 RepID=UPI0025739E36|nr:MFS transporter [Gordonia sp. ABSL1-1]MDL9937544.1 MFS transporter [Gordonia sp. ABSL1-1]
MIGDSGSIDLARVRLRTLILLCAAQILGGLSMGASLALGSILGEELSGSGSLAGVPTTVLTLGAAAAGLPLAALAQRRGRRPALATGLLIAACGAVVVAVAVDTRWFLLLLIGMAGVGAGTAVGLQARFAATDLSAPTTRGRDLSLVVWMTMVGAVAGPALIPAGARVAAALGLDDLAGPFLIGAAGSLLAAGVLIVGLRPDPLHLAGSTRESADDTTWADVVSGIRRTPRARAAVATVVSAHAVMIAVMALTPVHLHHGGASLTIVGLSISAHLAGMYFLAPVMGVSADRFGRVQTILAGQAILVIACLVGFLGADSRPGLVAALILLGVGWSASTVAAAALLTESVDVAIRTRAQGFSDTVMSLAGAVAGAVAGVVVGAFGYPVLVLGSAAVAVVTAVQVGIDGRPARWNPLSSKDMCA